MVKKIHVLVTGVGGGSIGEQVMFALRTAETPYRIITADMDICSLGLHRSDKGYLVPGATSAGYLSCILKICKAESVDVLIPGSEPELFKVAKNVEFYKDQGILPLVNDIEVIEQFRNKRKGQLFLEQNGFNVPARVDFDSCDETQYPVIVKPTLGTGGSRFVFVAQNRKELSFFKGFLERNGCVPMFQKYVGTADNEYTVGVLTSFEGDLLGSIAIKRRLVGRLSTLYSIKNYRDSSEPIRISTGISQGVIEEFPEVRKNAEEVALKVGSKGPINVQCRVTSEGIFVFEVNPRFSGTESLRALAGFNAPDALIRRHILGETINKMKFKTGRVSRGLSNYFREDCLN